MQRKTIGLLPDYLGSKDINYQIEYVNNVLIILKILIIMIKI
jgi:hypothetical protein